MFPLHSHPGHSAPRHLAIRATLLCVLAVSSAALAAGNDQPATKSDRLAEARAKYEQDRALCLSGQSNQDRETCLKEAGAALQEARRGTEPQNGTDYRKNALLRCQSQPPEERAACAARVKGLGSKSGSVAEGGTITEYREIIPAPAAPPAAPPTAPPAAK